MIELTGKITTGQRLKGTTGALSNVERAEILAELDKLLQETDPEWLAKLGSMSIAGKLRYLQLCRGNILNAIKNKGVEIPDPQPFRTISALIDRIGGQGGEPVAYLYNGVRLHDIYSVYTPELQAQYPYAEITPVGDDNWYMLKCYPQHATYFTGSDGEYKFGVEETAEPPHGIMSMYSTAATAKGWQGWTVPESGLVTTVSRVLWANFNLLNEAGSVCLPASEPVPVYE